MAAKNTLRRRRFLQVGAATAGAVSSTAAAGAAVRRKAAGETRIVCVAGDAEHNPLAHEIHLRRIFGSHRDWRLLFVRAGRHFTPQLIADADLLITARHGGNDAMGFSAEPVCDVMTPGDPFWTGPQVASIIENVTKRGMGFLALHNTVECRNGRICGLLDIVPLRSYEIQPVWVHNLNREHPITRGIEPFYINVDEQHHALLKTAGPVILFDTSAVHDKREAVGGWCLERGRGRVVALLPGHTDWTYQAPAYQEILWRAAHWAMNREIPPYPGEAAPA